MARLGGRGRITIETNDKPVSEVVRSLKQQAGIRIGTNLSADAKVTMHVQKMPLLHALEVLSAKHRSQLERCLLCRAR